MADLLQEIRHALRWGSGFEHGKFRIMQLFERSTDEAELAKLIAKEYGIGGHSHTLLDGSHGFVDYDGKGIRITRNGFREDVALVPWNKVTRILRFMIDNDEYLDRYEVERYAAWLRDNASPSSPAPDDEDDAPVAQDDGPDNTPDDAPAPVEAQMSIFELLGGL